MEKKRYAQVEFDKISATPGYIEQCEWLMALKAVGGLFLGSATLLENDSAAAGARTAGY